MSNNDHNNQQGIRPPDLPLEEEARVNYNIIVNNYFIDGNLVKAETGDITMTNKSKYETTKTTVQAEKIEGSAIGKGNKALSFKLDGAKVIIIILAVTISALLLLALYFFVSSGGQINAFPQLQEFFEGVVSNLN